MSSFIRITVAPVAAALAITACARRVEEDPPAVQVGSKAASEAVDASSGSPPPSSSPSCAREASGRLPTGCPPEFGEDAWGRVNLLAINLLAVTVGVKDCFRSISDSGSSSFIPPMSAKCAEGPERKCERVATAAEITRPWQYALPTVEEDPAWHRVEVEDEYYWDTTDTTHIRFSWSNEEGQCEVWIEGVADLDGDEFYSTYLIGSYYEADGSRRNSLSRRELFPESPERRAQRALAE